MLHQGEEVSVRVTQMPLKSDFQGLLDDILRSKVLGQDSVIDCP